MMLTFTVEGQPIPKARPRVSFRGGKARAYTPQRTKDFEELVAIRAREAMIAQNFTKICRSNGIRITFESRFSIPKSWSKKKQADALAGNVLHTSRPDLDNLEKAICDALNDIVWDDDCQVCDVRKTKKYAEKAETVIEIETVEE